MNITTVISSAVFLVIFIVFTALAYGYFLWCVMGGLRWLDRMSLFLGLKKHERRAPSKEEWKQMLERAKK